MLDKEIQAKLDKPLDKTRVKHRQGGGGMQLSYIEGHDVIDTANLIFGYGNWGVETIDVWQVTEKEFVKGYAAKVRLEILNCRPITGIGFNPLQAGRDKETGASPDSHDMAIKGAETDAMKRCFRNFGDQFGNSLYDKTLVDGQPATTSQNRPTTATTARVTHNQVQSTISTTPALQPVKTVTAPAPNPVATNKHVFEVLGPATYGCPKCDGPVEVFRGVGTSTDPNEAYSGERCTSKGCGYKRKYEAKDSSQLTMVEAHA